MTGRPVAAGRHDCVVLGGGPAGTAAALVLAKAGARVLLVEGSRYAGERIGETFPPEIAGPLIRLNLWDEFQAAGHLPSFGVRSLWGSPDPVERSFIFSPYGHGWHVDRRQFDAFLATALVRLGAGLLRGCRFMSARRDEGGPWTLLVGSAGRHREVRADFVIDATGRPAHFTRRLGCRRVVHDRLIAAALYLTGPPEMLRDAGFALIEAVENGWWYSAPVPGDRLIVAFMTDADLHRRSEIGDSVRWRGHLERAPWTSRRAAALIPVGRPRTVLANTTRLDRFHGPRWLAVGDAAAAHDPMSGDGVLRALSLGIDAGQVVLSSEAGRMEVYSQELEESYNTYCWRHCAFSRREGRWPDAPFWARRRHDGGWTEPASHG